MSHRCRAQGQIPVIVENDMPWHEETEKSDSWMYKHPSGCEFSWNTAYTVPLLNAQNDAWPLKKAEFVQVKTWLSPSENVCVILPGMVEGMKRANDTPDDVE